MHESVRGMLFETNTEQAPSYLIRSDHIRCRDSSVADNRKGRGENRPQASNAHEVGEIQDQLKSLRPMQRLARSRDPPGGQA